MKKLLVILSISVVVIGTVLVALNFYPDFVHLSSIRYADNLEESSIQKGELVLTSEVTLDEEVDCKYVTFSVLDSDTKELIFKCENGWRTFDIKYLGFEENTDNILVISADTGEYRYVKDGHSWKEETVVENRHYTPDSEYYLVNNLSNEDN